MMAAGGLLIPLLIGAGTAAATAGISALTKPKAQTVVATPTIASNPAADAVRNSDLLRSRQGALANNLTGGTAGTPTPGVRALFGQGG